MSDFIIARGVGGKCLVPYVKGTAGPKELGGGTAEEKFSTSDACIRDRTCRNDAIKPGQIRMGSEVDTQCVWGGQMIKCSITRTDGDEWWLERIDEKGNELYPASVSVGKLGEERLYLPERVSIPKVCHGDHGPEPRFPGDVWTMYHVCGLCDEPVSKADKFCKNCGATLDWRKL